MFKKLFNKLMSNEETKNDAIPDENTRGAANPQESAPATSENQVPGMKVPEGHQVPGTDMSTGVSEQSAPKEPIANEITNNSETVTIDETKVDPMTPVGPN